MLQDNEDASRSSTGKWGFHVCRFTGIVQTTNVLYACVRLVPSITFDLSYCYVVGSPQLAPFTQVYHSDEEQVLVEELVEYNRIHNPTQSPFFTCKGKEAPTTNPEGYHHYPEFEHNGTILRPRLVKFGGGPFKLYRYRYTVKDTAEKDSNGNIVPKARALQPHEFDSHPDKLLQKQVDGKWKDLVVMQSAGAYMETVIHAVKYPKTWTKADLCAYIVTTATLHKAFFIDDFVKTNLSHLPDGPTKKYPDSLLDLEGDLKPPAHKTSSTNESPSSIASESSSLFEDAQQHSGSPDQLPASRAPKTPFAEALPLDQAAIEGTPMFQLMYSRMKTAEKRERQARQAAARTQHQADSERQFWQRGVNQLIANNTKAVDTAKTAADTAKTAVDSSAKMSDTNAKMTNAFLEQFAINNSSGMVGGSNQDVVPSSASVATKKGVPKPPPGAGAAGNYSGASNQEHHVTFNSTTFEACKNPASTGTKTNDSLTPAASNTGQLQDLSGDGLSMVSSDSKSASAAAPTSSFNSSSSTFSSGATNKSSSFTFDGGFGSKTSSPFSFDDSVRDSDGTAKSGTKASAAAATPSSLTKIADSVPKLAEEATKPESMPTGDAVPNGTAFSFQGQSTRDMLIKFYHEDVGMLAEEATVKVDFILSKPVYRGKEGEVRLLQKVAKKYKDKVDASVFGLAMAVLPTSSGNPGASSVGFTEAMGTNIPNRKATDDHKVVDSDDAHEVEDGKIAKGGATVSSDSSANKVNVAEPEEAAAGRTTDSLAGLIGMLRQLVQVHLQGDNSPSPELLEALTAVVQNLGDTSFVGYDNRPEVGEVVMIKQTSQVGVVIAHSGTSLVLLPDGSTSNKQKKSLKVLRASRRNQE